MIRRCICFLSTVSVKQKCGMCEEFPGRIHGQIVRQGPAHDFKCKNSALIVVKPSFHVWH